MEMGQRYSRKRSAIYAALCASRAHPTAEMLYRALKEDYPDLSLGTVYRNLARFKEEGAAVSVGVVAGQERFDGNTHPHPHLICRRCGGVFDLPGLEPDQTLAERAERLFGHKVERQEMIFHGLCQTCRDEGNRSS